MSFTDQTAQFLSTPPPNHLLNVQQAATHLNVSIHTIRSWVRKKIIPFFKIGSLIRFSQPKLDEWLDSHKGGA